jgi:hypothetical protein
MTDFIEQQYNEYRGDLGTYLTLEVAPKKERKKKTDDSDQVV